MKKVLFLISMIVSAVSVWAQDDPMKQHDAVIKRMLERWIAAPPCTGCDSTGIMLVRVEKKDGKLYTNNLFNTVKKAPALEAAWLNKEQNKDKIGSLPEGFNCTVPVLFYFGSSDGRMHEPTAAARQQLAEMLGRLRGKERVIGEIVVVGYGPNQKVAPQP